jgi:outer membrane protein assembly factor BamB
MRVFFGLFLVYSLFFVMGCIDKAHLVESSDTDSMSQEARELKAEALQSQIDGLNPLTLEVLWYYPLPEERITRFTHRGELLFVETERHLLYAIEPATGVVRWVFQCEDPLDFAPALSKTHVSFTCASVLFLLDSRGGNLIWKQTMSFTVSSGTALDRQNVYVGSFDDFFYAYNLEGRKAWRFRTEGSLMLAPLTETPLVYFISEDLSIYAVNVADGTKSWEFKMLNRAKDNPYIYDYVIGSNLDYSLLYVPSDDFNLYCIDRITGNIFWKYEAGEEVLTTPVVSGDACYSACTNKLVGIQNRTGHEMFSLEGQYQVLARGKSDIYVTRFKEIAGQRTREMLLVDGAKGTVKAKAPISKFEFALTNRQDGLIFLASRNGVLFTLKEQ